MGIIKKTIYTGIATGTALFGYIGATTSVIWPLPLDDPIFTSDVYNRYNPFHNPPTQDVCVKRIPLSKIRPELLQKEGDLAVEFCRGVWSGWGEFFSSLFSLVCILLLIYYTLYANWQDLLSHRRSILMGLAAKQKIVTYKQDTSCSVACSPRSTRPRPRTSSGILAT